MKKYLIVTLLAVVVFAGMAEAQSTDPKTYNQMGESFNQLNHAAGAAGVATTPMDPRLIIANAIKIALGVVATILFILNIYAGYIWMTAGGNEDKVDRSKTTIRNSIYGLIIILGAYAITIAVTNLAIGRDVGSGANRGSTIDDAIQNGNF